jgi:aminoglycoside 6'-N-acetyltransferase
MVKLKQHEVILEGKTPPGRNIRLRSMTEDDWDILAKWNSDPEVLYYSEGGNVTAYTLEQVQEIYRSVGKNAFCFIIEVDGKPVGECWLQKMNLERILQKYPDVDCRRIDLMIGEKQYWGKGIGTLVIHLLTEFGFVREDADIIFGITLDYNVRCIRAFQKAGYEIVSKIKEAPGRKANYEYDLALTKEEFFEKREKGQ